MVEKFESIMNRFSAGVGGGIITSVSCFCRITFMEKYGIMGIQFYQNGNVLGIIF